MHANSREDVKEARAGDIVAIAGLKVRLRWTASWGGHTAAGTHVEGRLFQKSHALPHVMVVVLRML